ncbi:hypothetical protein [Dyadobacter diqingensis]|uniref:hypothetical protein n=1 Tax=Dyadobacter diqingensis TaxID=2938121 RepID=UPI0020C1A626|nr:hypothetical protein [Dyadobacter diqingensis]
MNRLINLVAVFAILFLLGSCGKDSDDPAKPTEKSKILVNYPWLMTSVTDLKGVAISPNQLNLETRAISEMEIQFLQNNVVKAKDKNTQQVTNGGTWALQEDTNILDIKISGFSGAFGVEEISNSKLKLKNKMPVNGVEVETIMVFDPVIK